MDHLIENLCRKLQGSLLSVDLQKLDHARDMLTKLQHRDTFKRVLGTAVIAQYDYPAVDAVVTKKYEPVACHETSDTQSVNSEDCCEMCDEEDYMGAAGLMEDIVELPEDTWCGFFKGFKLLTEPDEIDMNDNKMCIEVTKNECNQSLENYFRAGVRCFLVDLFSGTEKENQQLIVRLRESELNISKEFGFPITATIFAKLSPRLQYTGLLDPPQDTLFLHKDDKITLTTDRYCSTRGSKTRIYVNAFFLIPEIKKCDFLLIGPDIQVIVNDIQGGNMHCIVVVGGALRSRLPVFFPLKCNRFRMSMEELEDITFANEVGINVIVSYIAGSKVYFENLQKCLQLLHCDKMRLCARIVLNDIRGDEGNMNWAAECYDGFLIELQEDAAEKPKQTDIMHICPAGDLFIKRVYELHKPIIMDPAAILNKRYVVDPQHNRLIFYYPDKYVYKCDVSDRAFSFNFLQEAIFEPKPETEKLLYCDESHTGSDSLARSCVTAAFEMNAKAILVLSVTGRMAIKISHFRPNVPIILITSMKSAGNFIMMYHNIIMLYYNNTPANESHHKSVYNHIVYGLIYAKKQNFIKDEDNVMFLYGHEPGTKFPDKYVAYKFDESHFTKHLRKILF